MTRLTLLAQDEPDLPALSALVQDATLRTPDIAFDARAHRLVLLINRYRWEAPTPSRIRSALRIDSVLGVSHRNWPKAPDSVLSLLTLGWTGEHLLIEFSDSISLRLRCEALDLILEDLGDPWPTSRKPSHKV